VDPRGDQTAARPRPDAEKSVAWAAVGISPIASKSTVKIGQLARALAAETCDPSAWLDACFRVVDACSSPLHAVFVGPATAQAAHTLLPVRDDHHGAGGRYRSVQDEGFRPKRTIRICLANALLRTKIGGPLADFRDLVIALAPSEDRCPKTARRCAGLRASISNGPGSRCLLPARSSCATPPLRWPVFFTAVKTTGNLLSTGLSGRATPAVGNLTFLSYSGGKRRKRDFRPCLRCRPETAP